MSKYIQVTNKHQQLILDDEFSNYSLEAVVHLGSLPKYSTDDEYNGGICDRVDFYNKDGNSHGYPYPFFCCLGTKYLGKVCVIYNKSNVDRPCVVINSFTGCCRSYNEGTRKAHSVVIKGDTPITISWPANYKDMYGLYYGIFYPDNYADHIPFEAMPECLGTAVQPVAIICDSDANGLNLQDYYVLVFGKDKKEQPSKNDVALCCYDENGVCVFSSKNYPLKILEHINGSGALDKETKTHSGKIGVSTLMYYSGAMPMLTNNSTGFKDSRFRYDLSNVGAHRCWYWMYEEILNGYYFCRYRFGQEFSYLIIDIDSICKAYGI